MDAATRTDAMALEVPPDPRTISLARLFVGAVARSHGLDEDLIDDVKIATSEAVTNAIKAHLAAEVAEPVTISVLSGDDELAFEIVDRGPGFEVGPSSVDAITPPAGLFEGSLGLTVVRALFPEVQIARNESGGITVRFSASLRRAPTGG